MLTCERREDTVTPIENSFESVLSTVSVADFVQIATLGVGGFGRVELVLTTDRCVKRKKH